MLSAIFKGFMGLYALNKKIWLFFISDGFEPLKFSKINKFVAKICIGKLIMIFLGGDSPDF